MASEKTEKSETKKAAAEAKAAGKTLAAARHLITIESLTGLVKSYNLASEPMREHPDHGYRRVNRVRSTHNPKTGEVGYARDRITLPGSLHLAGFEKKPDLPAAIAGCPEIKSALRRGLLKITKQ